MIKLHSIFKSRDITLLIYVHIVKAMSFLIVKYRCKSWIIKKAECQRTDAFELWCWRRFLRVPWNADTKPTNPKEHQPWIFIERTISKAEVPLLWPPRKDWRQKKGWQRIKWLDSITDSVDMNLSKLWEIVEDTGAWCATVHRIANSLTTWWLNNFLQPIKAIRWRCRQLAHSSSPWQQALWVWQVDSGELWSEILVYRKMIRRLRFSPL